MRVIACASISKPTSQRNSRLHSICSISFHSERSEKKACSCFAYNHLSGGIEGRPQQMDRRNLSLQPHA